MLSPSNTRTGLTRPAAGAAADEPGRYYPRGIRNYARLVAPEDAQVRVDVRLARRLGARRVFVLDDGDDYGIRLGRDFRALASGLGVRVVGDAAWGKSPESQVRAAKRAEAAGAEAVFVSGIWQRRGVEMVGALRRVLGPGVPLIAPDGFVSLPRDTLPAMRGLWVSAAGLPPERFPAGGRAVARRFGPGQPNSLGPAYAAQAVEVLMGAIARSDGSRQSVSRELLKTNTRITVLGPVRFDSNGDLIGAPISIHRVTPRELRLERVVVP
jgi:branched-chain amino acid transport system substrate-binding protein